MNSKPTLDFIADIVLTIAIILSLINGDYLISIMFMLYGIYNKLKQIERSKP